MGSFTKLRAESTLRVQWQAHATQGSGFCNYQIRIDGKNSNGDAGVATSTLGGETVVYAPEAPMDATVLFGGITAGSHAVQIYVRGSAPACTLNQGNFSQMVLVEEFQANAASVLTPASDPGLSPATDGN